MERALELDPSHVGAHEELADFYYFAPGIVGGSKKKAATQIEALQRVSPADADRVRGRHAYNGGEYRQAEAYYSEALVIEPDNADLWYLRGLARRQQLEKDEAALADFDRAIELGFVDPMIDYQVGRLCVRLDSCAERGESSLRSFIEQSEDIISILQIDQAHHLFRIAHPPATLPAASRPQYRTVRFGLCSTRRWRYSVPNDCGASFPESVRYPSPAPTPHARD